MLNATIIKRIDLTPELLILHVRPDGGVPDFIPGQYVALGLPASSPRLMTLPGEREVQEGDKLIKRAYSIGSSPELKDYLEFYLAVVPDGSLTARIAALREGDRIFAAPKIVGTFSLDGVPADHNLVMVATGTGLAPFTSMLRTSSTWTPNRRLTLIHGVRNSRDLAFREEMEGLAERFPQFSYIPMVSRDDPEWRGRRGRVTALFENIGDGLILEPELDHIFLCGNPSMIDQMEATLLPRGYREHSRRSPGNLHLERYW